MSHEPVLDALLVTLDVAVEAFAVCEIGKGRRLSFCSQAIEVHYVLSGTMHLIVPDHPPIRCGPGSVVLIPPNMAQIIAADERPAIDMDPRENCRLNAGGLLVFDAADGATGDLRIACGVIVANISGSFGLLDAVRRPIVEDMGDLDIVRLGYAQLLQEMGAPGLGSRALAGALMKMCLVQLLRRHFAHDGHGTSLLRTLRDPRLGKAVAAVIADPAAAHSVASLGQVAGMSRSAFAREFAAQLAMSPMAFVTRTRLHHAAELLKSTRLPVKMIAATIGFASRSHFSRAFSAAYGADPSRFRETRTAAEALVIGAGAVFQGANQRTMA